MILSSAISAKLEKLKLEPESPERESLVMQYLSLQRKMRQWRADSPVSQQVGGSKTEDAD